MLVFIAFGVQCGQDRIKREWLLYEGALFFLFTIISKGSPPVDVFQLKMMMMLLLTLC